MVVEVESFEQFYRREYRSVLALAYALAGRTWIAEELSQEAFAAAYRSWDDIENPGGWVRTAVTNKTHSWRRRRYAEVGALTRIGHGRTSVEDSIPAETAEFWAEVRKLPNRQAQAVALYYLEDRPTDEAAAILGCSASTFREHLMRARRTLADRFDLEEDS